MVICVFLLFLVSGIGDFFLLFFCCFIVDEGFVVNLLLRFFMFCCICLIIDFKLLFCVFSFLIFFLGGKLWGFLILCEEFLSCFFLFGSCVGMVRLCFWRVVKVWFLVWVKIWISLFFCVNFCFCFWVSVVVCWYRNKIVYYVEGLLFGYWK